MTDNVINFAEKKIQSQSHLTVHAVCMQCRHKWVAVAPIGTYVYECPSCHVMKGVAEGFVKSEHPSYTCHVCTSQLFSVPWRLNESKPHLLCANCGTDFPWEEVCSL